MTNKRVFISYRRETGGEVARLLQSFLEVHGFDVFLDVDGLGTGHFDRQLLREIESRPHFLLVCSPGALDRCTDPADWVRREIAHAIQHGRHIVPIVLPNFAWPAVGSLPTDISEVCRHNHFEYSHRHWKLTRDSLRVLLEQWDLTKAPVKPDDEPKRTVTVHGWMRHVLWIAVAGLGLSALLFILSSDLQSPDLSKSSETPWSKARSGPAFESTGSLQTNLGRTASLTDLRGRVVVLYFWATWCGPSKECLPTIDALSAWAESEGHDIEVLGVCVDRGDPAALNAGVSTFLKTQRSELETFLDGSGEWRRTLGVKATPTIVLLNGTGEIVPLPIGWRGCGSIDGLKRACESALNQ